MIYKWMTILNRAVCVAFLLTVSPLSLMAAEKSETPDAVKAAKEKYATVLQKNFKKAALAQLALKATFLKELEQDMLKQQKAGKLRETVALKKRIESIRNDAGFELKESDPGYDSFQKKLAKIESDKAEDDLKDTQGYIKYLKKKIAAATKAGKLELGLAFDKELKHVTGTADKIKKDLEPEPTAQELRVAAIEKSLGYKLKKHPLGTEPAPRSAKEEGFNGHYYKLIAKPMNWNDAKKKCEEMGGYPVCITTKEEYAFVTSLVQKKGTWTGAKLGPQKKWEWLTKEPGFFVTWQTGQPNYRNNEYFILIGENGKAWDVDGQRSVAVICEFEY